MFTTYPSLSRSISVLFFIFLVSSGLYFARDFLIPVAISTLLAMLFLPLCRWLEGHLNSRVLAALLCVLIFMISLTSIILLLSWQASNIPEDITRISDRLRQILESIRFYIADNLKISVSKQKDIVDAQTAGAGNGTGAMILSFLMNMIINTILVLVYLFLFLYSRSHLKKFLLMLVPENANRETQKVIEDSGKVAQRYISGMGTMIVILWVLYGIGFSAVGVKSAIFFAILCGLLEIIPFIGNFTGTTLTVLMVISQGGSNGMIIGVLVTYLFVQFIQTYILEPLVVGSEVNLNPLFTILILVLMEIIWGIPGMILAIPMLGIVKIVCDHVKPLKPYGFLIGKEQPGKETSLISGIKAKFGRSK